MSNNEIVLYLQDIKLRNSDQLSNEEKEALDLAIKSVCQIDHIKTIINYQPAIQEDVFRYKAICKVLDEPTLGGNTTWVDILN